MKNRELEDELLDREIEIFSKNEHLRRLINDNKELKKYQGMYFNKVKEINKIKKVLEENLELLPDQVKFNFKNLLEELSGIKYN